MRLEEEAESARFVNLDLYPQTGDIQDFQKILKKKRYVDSKLEANGKEHQT